METIIVKDTTCPAGDVVDVTFRNLDSRVNYVLHAETVDELDQRWIATVPISPDEAGSEATVLLDDVMARATYAGSVPGKPVSRLKLAVFTAMQRRVGSAVHRFLRFSRNPCMVQLTLSGDDLPRTTTTLSFVFAVPGVTCTATTEPMPGLMFTPVSEPRGAVLVLTGSAGGTQWSEQVAAALASRGYAAYAPAYFDFRGRNGLPRSLERIDIARFAEAAQWLIDRTKMSRVAIIGLSKGAEAALLTATHVPELFSRVAALSPGAYAFDGVYTGSRVGRPSWTLNGRDLPFLPYPEGSKPGMIMPGGELLRLHEGAIKQASPARLAAAEIPAELFPGPVLLVSGGMDETWPAAVMAEQIRTRRETVGSGSVGKTRLLHFPEAGHVFTVPGLPPTTESDRQSPQAMARANREAWQTLLAFLED
ncbi:MAG: alpha/beta hydrolase family protein [Alkalispirochaeta sp.]